MKELKFTVIGDLHYKKRMYAARVEDLSSIMKRAAADGAELAVHLGDFSNDYLGSPEILNAYLNNTEGLPVFGVIGNHELESRDNSLEYVLPRLSNRIEKLVYGSLGGKTAPYFYYDIKCFRLIFLDTNYSLTEDGRYEHNRTASWGAPKENTLHDSLGEEQIAWISETLSDAAEAKKRCIVFSHASFSPEWKSSPDAKAVRELFREANAKREKTVILAINGHYHTYHLTKFEGVHYFDCPAAINAHWQSAKFHPYEESDPNDPIYTFDFTDYGEKGEAKGKSRLPYSALRMGAQSLFFKTPLSATVTLKENGEMIIKGSKAELAPCKVLPEGARIDTEIPDTESI
ncbi:MAG: metallophosphoesterase [Clostridia bacterium]|nr:metallophosphoesterase [Clostridia bacterium]